MEAFSLQGPGTWAFSLQGEALPFQGEAFSLQDRGFFPSGQGKPCPGVGTWEGETEVALTRHQTPKGSADYAGFLKRYAMPEIHMWKHLETHAASAYHFLNKFDSEPISESVYEFQNSPEVKRRKSKEGMAYAAACKWVREQKPIWSTWINFTCPRGMGLNPEGSECVRCEAGKYSESLEVDCRTCRPGTFAEPGLPKCESCQPGRYANGSITTRAACAACPKGRYAESTGASACSTCLGATTTFQNAAIRAAECGCDFGFYNSGQGTCHACPDWMKCTTFNSAPKLAKGYWAEAGSVLTGSDPAEMNVKIY